MEHNENQQDKINIPPRDVVVSGAPEEAEFDLSQADVVADANRGAFITLYHPTTGKPLSMRINVIGKDSDDFHEIQREQNRARLAKVPTRNRVAAMAAAVNAAEEQDRDAIELLAACTRGWENVKLDGKAVPFNQNNAIAIYTRFPWIKEQIDLAIADRANFTKG